MHASEFVLKDRQLVDLAKLFEHGPKVGFFEVTWDLADKQFDGFGFFGRLLLLLLLCRRDRNGSSNRWMRRSSIAVVV